MTAGEPMYKSLGPAELMGARPFRLRPVGNTNFSEVTSLAQKK